MVAKSTPAQTPAQPELPAHLVAIPFNRVDPYTLQDTRYEAGEPYPCDGPDAEKYLERGLIVPADAGSASESASTDDQEN